MLMEENNEMKDALKKGQFVPFLQPQYNHATGALVGAEALVRWKKDNQIIMPGEFIPKLEQTGLIYEVDQYIWEQVSIQLRNWIDEGKEPVPVSVNISRFDLCQNDFFEVITGIVKKYSLPADMLRLEVAEAALIDSNEAIIKTVNHLIEEGFTVEIDDFGNGYSSLNTLKDIPASILKIDMKFFSKTENATRSGSIIESVVRLTNWLDMTVMAEGVETSEQAEFLQTIGCYYVQGYLYAKPMSVKEYEKLLGKEEHEKKHGNLEKIIALDNSRFWDPQAMETLIFNSYVGGACIFERYEGRIELLRVNTRYLKELGSITTDGIKLDELNPINYLDENGIETFRQTMNQAVETKQETSCELQVNGVDGEKEYLYYTVRLLANTKERELFYCIITNRTSLREAQQREKTTADTLRNVLDHAGNGMVVAVLHKDSYEILMTNEKFYQIIGYTKEEYQKSIKNNVTSIVYSEDRSKIREALKNTEEKQEEHTVEIRVIRGDKKMVWLRIMTIQTRVYGIEDPVQVVTFSDVTEERETNEQLTFLNNAANDIIKTEEPESGIYLLMEKLLDYFKAVRTYIIEINWDTKMGNCTYEQCSGEAMPIREHMQHMPYVASELWVQKLVRQGYIYIENMFDMKEGKEETTKLLCNHGVHSFVFAPLKKGDTLLGLVGIDNPNMSAKKIGGLRTVTDYISLSLIKRDMLIEAQKNNQAIRFLMEDTPGGFCRMRVIPGEGLIILFANNNFCSILGITKDELQEMYGTDACRYIHPDDLKEYIKTRKKNLYNGEQINGTFRAIRKDGSCRPVAVYGRIVVLKPDEIYLNAYYIEIEEQEMEE